MHANRLIKTVDRTGIGVTVVMELCTLEPSDSVCEGKRLVKCGDRNFNFSWSVFLIRIYILFYLINKLCCTLVLMYLMWCVV